MTILEFAKKYKLVPTVDELDDMAIVGKHGDISDYGKDMFLASFCGENASSVRRRRIRDTYKNGFGIGTGEAIDGDEGTFIFSPVDKKASRWFIKAIGIKSTKGINKNAAEGLKKWRESHTQK